MTIVPFPFFDICMVFLFGFLVGTMIRLFKVKEKQKEAAASGNSAIKKQTAGELRLHKGLYLVLSHQ